MVLKFYVLLGHHTKLAHTKFCDKICHILQVFGENECARHYKFVFFKYLTHFDHHSLYTTGLKFCDLDWTFKVIQVQRS